jgi:hypothetical protein
MLFSLAIYANRVSLWQIRAIFSNQMMLINRAFWFSRAARMKPVLFLQIPLFFILVN